MTKFTFPIKLSRYFWHAFKMKNRRYGCTKIDLYHNVKVQNDQKQSYRHFSHHWANILYDLNVQIV